MVLRALAFVVAAALIAAGLVLAYIAIIAVRRSEGVFLPAGYVAVACLAASWFILRFALAPRVIRAG